VRPCLCDGSHFGHTGGLPMSRMIARGFSLIEVLVTLVILVFGLLGLVGLQARGTQVEFEAYQRGQAVGLVNEMAAAGISARTGHGTQRCLNQFHGRESVFRSRIGRLRRYACWNAWTGLPVLAPGAAGRLRDNRGKQRRRHDRCAWMPDTR
jgi:prepilin-type N-terminal cleavage/methylation domain-containing protein